MPSFNLYTGNRLELLLNDLADVVRKPHVSPCVQEIIVVQNKGMERWVATQLAGKLGIWAQCRYPFPNAFIDEIFSQTFPDACCEHSPFDPDILVWTLMDMLGTIPNNSEFAPLRDYMGIDGDTIKQYQLAAQIADVFDHYTMFRPDMVLAWENNSDNHWQAQLWRDIVHRIGTSHRARMQNTLLKQIKNHEFTWNNAVQRISIFGISSLPPFHINIIRALSSIIDVHLFMLNPCAEYWDDVASEREINRTLRRSHTMALTAEQLHFEQGNSLLAALGSTGRDFLRLLHDCEPQEHEHYTEPGIKTMLAAVQFDILHLQQRTAHSNLPSLVVDASDISIQMHSCHSPMREVTVLYDSLLYLFETIPGLTPSDIVVMTTDIETYAPYIHAQFGFAEDERMRIPYAVADRTALADSPVTNVFLTLLSLAQSRCTVSELLPLLEVPTVYAAFDFNESDIDTIRLWINNTNIRWGLDKTRCEAFVSPAHPENTWEQGLDAMLMGYAMDTGKPQLVSGIAAFDGIEGADAVVLGHFLDFMKAVDDIVRLCAAAHTLPEWKTILLHCLSVFFTDDETIRHELHTIRTAVQTLSTAYTANFTGVVDSTTVRCHLTTQLGNPAATGFLTGALTFCEMLPMRSIPFKVVCLLGVNDTAFPRKSRHVAWDFCAQEPRKGDRILEKEDRYLFLEALMSARDVFYISYTGQDEHNGSSHQPSVVVSELLDYCTTAFAASVETVNADGSEQTITNHILRTHPLQAFSKRYFMPSSRLLNYSRDSFNTGVCAGECVCQPQPFIDKPIHTTVLEPSSVIDIDTLCRFIVQPSRWFLEKNLGLSLFSPETQPTDTEPFFIGGLEGYDVGTGIVEHLINNEPDKFLYDYLRAEGKLPHGNLGKCAFDELSQEATAFVKKVTALFGQQQPETCSINGTINGYTITGSLHPISPHGLITYRFGKAKPHDKLKAWIRGVAGSVLGNNFPGISVLCTRDNIFSYTIPANARDYFKMLVDCFIQASTSPLHFFPATSWTYAEQVILKKKSPDEALCEARTVWTGNEYSPVESEAHDIFNSQCFGAVDPLDNEFTQLALSLYEPLIINEKKVDV